MNRVVALLVYASAAAGRASGPRGQASVTLSITTTIGEEIGVSVREIVGALNSSLVRVRRVIVDDDPRRRSDVAAASAHASALEGLLAEGVVTETASVDYSAAYTNGTSSVFFKLFGRLSGPVRNKRGRGFLSYLYEIETCQTPFLLHLDSDTRVYTSGARDPVADLVALVMRFGDVLGAALPVHLGTENCTLDAHKDRELLRRRGAAVDARGFFDLHDLSTQCYLLSLRKLRRVLPLPFKRANVEDSLSALADDASGRRFVVAAMLPHTRPPFYFRGQGKRFARDVKQASDDAVSCGAPSFGPAHRSRRWPPRARAAA